MPSLVRFLFVCAAGAGLVWGGLFALSEYGEPTPKEVRSTVTGVKIRR
jgi:hypothetical protein